MKITRIFKYIIYPLLFVILAFFAFRSIYVPINSQKAVLTSGFCYSYELPSTVTHKFRVYENGTRLDRSSIPEITAEGKGRAYAEGNKLYFAPSDNSNPAATGKKYQLYYTPRYAKFFRVLFFFYIVVLLCIFHKTVAKLISDYGTKSNLMIAGWAFTAVALLAAFFFMLKDPPEAFSLIQIQIRHFLTIIAGVYIGFSILRSIHMWKFDSHIIFQCAFFVTYLYCTRQAITYWCVLTGGVSIFIYMLSCIESVKKYFASFSEKKLIAAGTGLALVAALSYMLNILYGNWGQSSWMDSQHYDWLGWQIATGAQSQGDSYYMPVYQYGLAFFTFFFGHFFKVHQVVNVLMGTAYITLLCLIAWNFYRKVIVVYLAALLSSMLFYCIFVYTHMTQIESWYITIVMIAFFMLSLYWRKPSWTHLVLYALSIGLALNTRTQASMLFGYMMLFPFIYSGLKFKTRIIHVFSIGVIVGLTLIPWTLRNYVCEGRFSPSSEQPAVQMCLLNDPSVGFYGIRYDIGYTELSNYYEKTYPDKKERMKVMKKKAFENIFGDKKRLMCAMFWRSLSFWGLLPGEVWKTPPAPEQVDWKTWLRNIPIIHPVIFFLWVFSLIGIFVRRSVIPLFLTGGVFASMGVVVFAGFGEPRLSYPVMGLQLLASLAIFAAPVKGAVGDMDVFAFFSNKKVKFITCICIIALLVFLVSAHRFIGRNNTKSLMIEKIAINPDVKADETLPMLADVLKQYKETGKMPLENLRVRFKAQTSNYMKPPKYYNDGGNVFPKFVQLPDGETYYYIYPYGCSGYFGGTYYGSVANDKIFEDDIVYMEGNLLTFKGDAWWIKITKIIK